MQNTSPLELYNPKAIATELVQPNGLRRRPGNEQQYCPWMIHS